MESRRTAEEDAYASMDISRGRLQQPPLMSADNRLVAPVSLRFVDLRLRVALMFSPNSRAMAIEVAVGPRPKASSMWPFGNHTTPLAK